METPLVPWTAAGARRYARAGPCRWSSAVAPSSPCVSGGLRAGCRVDPGGAVRPRPGSRGRDDSAHLRMDRRSSHRSGRTTSRTARRACARGRGGRGRRGGKGRHGARAQGRGRVTVGGRARGPPARRGRTDAGHHRLVGASPDRTAVTVEAGNGARPSAVRGRWAGGLMGRWIGGSVGRGAPPRGRRARERRVLRRRSPHRCAPGASRWARTAAGSTSRCRRRFAVSRARAARQGPRHRAGPVAKHGRGSGGGARAPSARGSPRPSERGSPRPGGRGELSGRRSGALSPTCSTPPRARRTGCAARRSSSSGGSRPDGTRSG